jgi:hypothetical protein
VGAVNVAFPLSEISTSKALPESAVTVCSIESELVTVIVAPGATGPVTVYLKLVIEIPAAVTSAGDAGMGIDPCRADDVACGEDAVASELPEVPHAVAAVIAAPTISAMTPRDGYRICKGRPFPKLVTGICRPSTRFALRRPAARFRTSNASTGNRPFMYYRNTRCAHIGFNASRNAAVERARRAG